MPIARTAAAVQDRPLATNAIRFSFGVIRPQREFAIPYTKCHAATAKRAEAGAECRVYKHFCTKTASFCWLPNGE
jgi:hypothetical protein